MSKKNKKLKKKKLISAPSDFSAAVHQSNAEDTNEAPVGIVSNDAPKTSAAVIAPASQELQYVRGDVKKILLLLAVVIILLFALYYFDLKTSYITQFGDWIYKIMNIQTQ